ncbi:Uma2 family endonuclease [Carbonactinospora thermoautotrophica]|uniref:Uma2 family endonuclease n=1 Tax=Carbonactinospora thermoautotrophica TaxID=1469144 RepID=UPI003DA7EF3A
MVGGIALAHAAPYTVDDLFAMPDDGNRYEVLDGALIVSPAPTYRHQVAADRLRALIAEVLPDGLEAVTATAVRLDDDTGFIPDVLVTDADPEQISRDIPTARVLTVMEVVSPSTRTQDRITKPARYAAAGIPCYWRVELDAFPMLGQSGPIEPPAIVVTVTGSAETLPFGAGKQAAVPLAIDRDPGGPTLVYVKFDPAALTGRRHAAL